MRDLTINELESVSGGGMGSAGAGVGKTGAGVNAASPMYTSCSQVPKTVIAGGATLYDYSNMVTVCTVRAGH